MELEAYRQSAEAFLTELTREEYRHFAGLKETYEIEPIYEAHAELFTRSSVERLRGLNEASTPGSEQRRRLRMLHDFAVQGHIGHAGKQAEAELARREATLTFEVDGERLGFRESTVVQANEPDRERRAAIEQARLALIASELGDLYADLIGCQHAVARELGYGSYRELCAASKGIDLTGLAGQARAFTAESDPGYAYLVLSPVGGQDDFAILFHEGGHTEHYASVEPGLPFEFRMLGDNAITESFAFLLERLVENPAWLERRLGITDADAIAAHARATRTLYLRRYCAKFAYELELHDAPPSLPPLADRYAQLLSDGLRVPWSGESYLADVDPGFYSSCYLRAWALEAQLRRHFVDRLGELWFASAEAGALLQSLWRDGQRQTPDELLGEVTGERLDLSVLLADLALV